MKYLESMLQFASRNPPLNKKQHLLVNVSGIALYVVLIFSLDLWDDVGLSKGVIRNGFGATSVLYDFMYLLSTIIAVYAIYRLYKTIVELQQTQSNIGVNQKSILTHVCMLILTSFLALTQTLVLALLPGDKYLGTSLYIWGDMLLQCTICYICWTLGCSPALMRRRVVVVNHVGGRMQLKVSKQ